MTDDQADLELVTDYVANELSADRMVELYERLQTDDILRRWAIPAILVWSQPSRDEGTDQEPSDSRACAGAWFAEIGRIGVVSRELRRREEAGDEDCEDAHAFCDWMLVNVTAMFVRWARRRNTTPEQPLVVRRRKRKST